MPKANRITPFAKQCFVTLGVSLNIMSHGLVVGYTAALLPQLKESDSPIKITDETGSWIAGILGFALMGGNFSMPSLMASLGRRKANLISIVPLLAGWYIIMLAKSVPVLLVARFLQGLALGMSASISSILIGEYTSPKYRGVLLTTISLAIASGVLIVHTLGAFFSWKVTAFFCSCICIIDFIIILLSPESPSWLAGRGRYGECQKVFRWLRGDDEGDELDGLIHCSKLVRAAKDKTEKLTFLKKMRRKWFQFNTALRKKEFYKPTFLMIHLYSFSQWGGANILAAYTTDIYHNVIGSDANIPLLIFTVDLQRIISNSCAIYLIKRVKRRTMLIITCMINVTAFLSTAAYVYAKAQGYIQGHSAIGIALIHIHMLSIAIGTVPLPFIIAGEVFPLEYRGLASGISALAICPNLFITIKTVPFLFNNLGLHGAYCLYAGVVLYCFSVSISVLPETKDRTLQDIEDEFRGRPLTAEETKSMMSLTSEFQIIDRRCSVPVI